jgi:hypothetical protein
MVQAEIKKVRKSYWMNVNTGGGSKRRDPHRLFHK